MTPLTSVASELPRNRIEAWLPFVRVAVDEREVGDLSLVRGVSALEAVAVDLHQGVRRRRWLLHGEHVLDVPCAPVSTSRLSSSAPVSDVVLHAAAAEELGAVIRAVVLWMWSTPWRCRRPRWSATGARCWPRARSPSSGSARSSSRRCCRRRCAAEARRVGGAFRLALAVDVPATVPGVQSVSGARPISTTPPHWPCELSW